MSIQSINIGNVVNDGLGDDLRTAFEKVNANFSELNTLGTIQAINLSSTGKTVFKRVYKDDEGANVLEFKTLVAGTNIILQSDEEGLPNVVRINAIDPPSFRSISVDDSSTVLATFSRDISMFGGVAPGGTIPDIEVTSLGSTITIKTLFPITETLTNYDFGSLNENPKSIIDLLIQVSNIDFGTVDTPGGLNLNFGNILEF